MEIAGTPGIIVLLQLQILYDLNDVKNQFYNILI
jgi:hypothetical protein